MPLARHRAQKFPKWRLLFNSLTIEKKCCARNRIYIQTDCALKVSNKINKTYLNSFKAISLQPGFRITPAVNDAH